MDKMGMLTVAEPYLTTSFVVGGAIFSALLVYSLIEIKRYNKMLNDGLLLRNQDLPNKE